jgi:Xaa-Pro aminopeptidase
MRRDHDGSATKCQSKKYFPNNRARMHTVTLQERRIERLWAALAEERLDALVVAGKGLIGQYGAHEWCAGYVPVVRGAYAVLRPGAEPALVVTTAADAWYARRNTGLAEVRVAGQGDILSEYDDPASGVAALVPDGGRIGVAGLKHVMSSWEAERLAAALPGAELLDVSAQVAAVKAVKDPEDIEELRATAAIADTAFEAFLEKLWPGASGWELSGEIEHVIRSHGTRDALIFISAGAYFLERPTADPVGPGDLLTVFIEIVGPTGYWVELGRLVAVGELDAEREQLAETCLAAAQAAESELVAGRTAGDPARAIDEVAARAGLGVGIWHGHGVGVDHDPPVITAADTTQLVPGMVISVHPNFSTADERLGASVADTYVVGEGPPQRLSCLAPVLYRA